MEMSCCVLINTYEPAAAAQSSFIEVCACFNNSNIGVSSKSTFYVWNLI